MPTSATPQYLLEGAAYALEQCGLLLRDANTLYRSGSYSSAVALALFAREELGRYRILLDLRKKVLGGYHLTTQEIQKRCKPHERKQEAGMLSFVMRITDHPLGGVLGTYLTVKYGSNWSKPNRVSQFNVTNSVCLHSTLMPHLKDGVDRQEKYLRYQHMCISKMPLMIIQGSMIVTLTPRLTSLMI
jgi:hypothetical protein